MASALGTLSVLLELNSAQFTASMKQASSQTTSTMKSISSSIEGAKNVAHGLAAAFALNELKDATQRAFDYADAIQDLSDRTGASTKFIQEFGYAAQLSGSSVENARAGIEKFSKNLGEAQAGNQQMAKTFKDLGVTSTDVDTAVRQAADGISKISSKSEQAARTVELFGKKGQDLTATLSGGAASLNDWAAKAKQLGIIIDSKLIANAGQFNDRLDTMHMILNAQFANTIVQNADALTSLATAMSDVTTQLMKFMGSNPQLALSLLGGLAGAAAGARAGGYGALAGGGIGALGGYYLGGKMQQASDDANPDLMFRRDKLLAARSEWDHARASAAGQTTPDEQSYLWGTVKVRHVKDESVAQAGGGDVHATAKEYQRQVGLYLQAQAAAKAGGKTVGGGTLPGPTGPKGPPDRSAQIASGYQRALNGEQQQEYGLRGQLATDPNWQAYWQHQSISANLDSSTKQISDDLQAGKFGDKDSALAKSRADELVKQNNINAELDHALVNRRLDDALAKQDLDLQNSALQNQSDILTGEQQMARTQAERRDIGLKLVDLEFEREKAAQQAIIDSKSSSDVEKQIAQARLNTLGTLQDNAKQQVVKSTVGPGQSYLDSIPKSAGEINESLQNVAVQGLQSLNDGLTDAMMNAKSLGDVFSNVTKTIIAGLLKIAIQQAIIKPLGNLLFGGGSSGGAGGLFGSLFGHRANGGLTRAGSYVVGERGPEVVNIGNTANVVSHRALAGALRGSNDNGITINSTVNGVNDPAQVRALSAQSIMQATPAITSMSSDRTMARASYPKMR